MAYSWERLDSVRTLKSKKGVEYGETPGSNRRHTKMWDATCVRSIGDTLRLSQTAKRNAPARARNSHEAKDLSADHITYKTGGYCTAVNPVGCGLRTAD